MRGYHTEKLSKDARDYFLDGPSSINIIDPHNLTTKCWKSILVYSIKVCTSANSCKTINPLKPMDISPMSRCKRHLNLYLHSIFAHIKARYYKYISNSRCNGKSRLICFCCLEWVSVFTSMSNPNQPMHITLIFS